MPEYKSGDIVRIIVPPSGTGHIGMIGSYIGQEARILHKHPELDLYQVELDVPRKPPEFGGALAPPTFIVRSDMIEPDASPAMVEAGQRLLDEEMGASWWSDDETANHAARADLAVRLYRKMRSARFGR